MDLRLFQFMEDQKKRLCGDYWFGNIFYSLVEDLDCTCCALWRGLVIGVATGLIVGVTIGLNL